MHTAHASLFQRLGQHLVRKAIDLDIHLGSRDTVLGTRHLEVHVAQVVLIAQDVGKHRPTTGSGIRNQTHGDTRNGFLEFTPASISASVPAQTVAIDDEPFDSRISDTTRTA